jgi:hypothetical protein
MTAEQVKKIITTKNSIENVELKLLEEFSAGLENKLQIKPRQLTDEFVYEQWLRYKKDRNFVYNKINI